MAQRLPTHKIVLRDPPLVLRPMSERDWPLLVRWNRDPDVLAWVEAEPTAPRDLAQTQQLYRSVAATPAWCFIIKWQGREIGDCWLQRMNVPALIERDPNASLWRIDIAIGERQFWGQGIGPRAIALLVRFGFEHAQADAIFALIDRRNERSRRAFLAAGFFRDSPVRSIDLLPYLVCTDAFRTHRWEVH
jgi:RimJ/RimL family protein N-acetyltransferase